ncbi:MMPL family transporter [Clostridium cellulovorans]|uniref:MmpL domain-containing protein n=1 Tax=Clostridium cellulovorans (strain ATCC 35296 / DSM 3052 / OCM 3 / 743B) TaxID=573061 RepID=D9SWK1_CLOC7|nr:MMPL family transporter [Clostridium cellulovorans]ADL53283.1 MmpL domain-containing protein [Clostridium cellulovorans 743B]
MKKILKHRWVILSIWIVATILFTINQPNLKQILNEKGEATIPDTEASIIASKMLDKMGTSKGDSLLIVFNDENKISDDEMKDIEKSIDRLNESKDRLQITNIIDPFKTTEAKDQLISKDETTILVQVSFEKGTRDNKTVINDFDKEIEDVKVKHYITGSLAINNDYTSDVGKGVDKSGIITIGFILIVLILMFRSVVTPIVSLLAVGVSYLSSMGIIGILIHQFNFPVTSFTQMFVILVLFGIGTDYHILLFNRFKEELSHGLSIDEAVVTSYKTAGKTIIYSGLTVLMAFASLSFVKFPVYRSANAVAIGIAALLIEIMTFTPLLMKILGGKLFWPSKNAEGHKESRFWGKAAEASVKHPVLSLLIVAIILAPTIIFNTTKLSFDSIKDLSTSNPSVQGFNIVVDKFGAGKVMQTTIVLENDEAMGNNEDLAVIDNLTEKLKKLEGIKEVYGPTQPKGEMIEDLYTNSQTKTVASGLSSTNDGVKKVKDGLTTMNNSLSIPDLSPVKDLSNGTGELQNGMDAITAGLSKINDGISQGVNGADNLASGIEQLKGADNLASGIEQLKGGISKLNGGLQAISSNITKINKGYTDLGQGYKSLPVSIGEIKQFVTAMDTSITNLDGKFPGDPDVKALKETIEQLSKALDNLTKGINTANTNYDTLTSSLSKVNEQFQKIIEGTNSQSQLFTGINDLENGAKALSDGLKKGSAGQKQVIESMAQLKNGAGKIKTGQDALYDGLSKLSDGMTQLKDGLSKSSDGLNAISDGINKSDEFLTQLTSTKSFYIPKEAFDKAEITKMLDMYMSKDRKIAKFTVTLETEPYADDSINLIKDINTFTENQLKGTKLSDAKVGIAGSTSASYDLKNIATHDITFTQIIVLIAIFILLIIVIRSFWIPVYIIGSLIAAYYTSLLATAFISKLLFSSAKDGLAWNVPFFSFVMIAALGVDYSIFLMMRYKEYNNLSQKEAIVIASKNIGGVVMSAAIILAGTFATLYPSNVVVLMELAICVVIGLFLLSFILLPIVIPALMSLSDGFLKKKNVEVKEEVLNQ